MKTPTYRVIIHLKEEVEGKKILEGVSWDQTLAVNEGVVSGYKKDGKTLFFVPVVNVHYGHFEEIQKTDAE